jgi:ankyrin repeat protein
MVRKLLEVHAPMLASERIVTFAMDRGCRETSEIIELLAKSGADVNARGASGATPIFDAQFAPEAVKALLAAGADIDAQDDIGKTALVWNAWNEGVVRELLVAGADPTLAAKNGNTALKAAQHSACSNCAALIEAALKQRSGSGNGVPSKPLSGKP